MDSKRWRWSPHNEKQLKSPGRYNSSKFQAPKILNLQAANNTFKIKANTYTTKKK